VELYETIKEELKKPSKDIDWKLIEGKLPEIEINKLNDNDENLLFWFTSCGAPVSTYSKALDLGINPNQKNNRYGRTCAFYIKNVEILGLLKKYGLNINHLDDAGWTFAEYNIDFTDVFSFAVESGLDLSCKNQIGRGILFRLIDKARLGDFSESLEILMKNGLDINETDDFGMTPVHYAVIVSNLDALKSLCSLNPDISIKLVKDFNWEIESEEFIKLSVGDTIFDTVRKFGEWAKNITDSIGGEWVNEQRYKHQNYNDILTSCKPETKKGRWNWFKK